MSRPLSPNWRENCLGEHKPSCWEGTNKHGQNNLPKSSSYICTTLRWQQKRWYWIKWDWIPWEWGKNPTLVQKKVLFIKSGSRQTVEDLLLFRQKSPLKGWNHIKFIWIRNWSALVRSGLALCGLLWFCSAWSNLVRSGFFLSGFVQYGLIWSGLVYSCQVLSD